MPSGQAVRGISGILRANGEEICGAVSTVLPLEAASENRETPCRRCPSGKPTPPTRSNEGTRPESDLMEDGLFHALISSNAS